MATSRPSRVGNVRTAVTLAEAEDAPTDPAARVARQRRLVAGLCRMLDPQPTRDRGADHPTGATASDTNANNGHADAGGGNGHAPDAEAPLPAAAARLSPRMRQTLERLLAGDSEKEIAARFGRSKHTVHVYVKKLYERFNVCSRGELFAQFVRAPAAPPAPQRPRPHGVT